MEFDELVITTGETLAIKGPSGCGKTTLLQLIAGILKPQSGVISWRDKRISNMAETVLRDFRLRTFGMVFQSFELLEYLSVRDNILLPVHISMSLRLNTVIQRRAVELAEKVGIAEKLPRKVKQLSQGERQRVAICRALLLQPEVILADEPTGNLDPGNRRRVFNILLSYALENGATLITVTHDQSLLDRFSRVLDFQQLNQSSATV
ncbi:MAG: ATP-binding cassette domain-containing protein [Halioglobus sp.]|nr:ATP-binding cassette domain-containing protein [Halioglobus sp.]